MRPEYSLLNDLLGLGKRTSFSKLEVQAARYAVLQHIAPLLRHRFVQNLQAVSRLVELSVHRAAGDAAGPAADGMDGRIADCLNAAMRETQFATSWLALERAASISVESGIGQCARLLSASLEFRGYSLAVHAEKVDAMVGRDILRMVLTTAILALASAVSAPAHLTVRVAGIEYGCALLEVGVQAGDPCSGLYFPRDHELQKLGWRHVQILASAEGVGSVYQENRIYLRFPLVKPRRRQDASSG